MAADAAINTWNDKYHFELLAAVAARSVRASDDENDATVADDPNVDAAPHRALPRARVGTPRARQLAYQRAEDVLRQRTRGGLPDHEQLRESRRARCPPTTCPATRTFTSFSQAVGEIVEARIWAGLHFRTADVQAVEAGTNIANFGAANYFQPVGNH